MTILRRSESARTSYVERNWTGEKVVIIGGGPSLSLEQLEQVRRAHELGLVKVVAVNTAYLVAPFADLHYFADPRWWHWHSAGIAIPALKLSAQDVRTRFAEFKGERCCIESTRSAQITDETVHIIRNVRADWTHSFGLSNDPEAIVSGYNAGFQAVNVVALAGAAIILLLGFDGRPDNEGRSHFFGAHPLPTFAAAYQNYRMAMSQAEDALAAAGVRVINCTPGSAIDSFRKMNLAAALRHSLNPDKEPLVLNGMSGMGDNLHQRAVVRELMREHELWLKTPWPQVYHDMPQLHMLPKATTLRTQAKNEARSGALYDDDKPPAGAREIKAIYMPERVKATGSVLGAMAEACGVELLGDFRMPVPNIWRERAEALFPATRPILVYRPLVARNEWGGATTRNPDPRAYLDILQSIRSRFFIVSVADLVPKVEWTVGPQIEADIEYHTGELNFEALAGLFARAALVYSAPGFAALLAQAVGTPSITVFGGYEDARSFSAGARFTPWLPIEPISPCPCWSHTHTCRKTIDIPGARTAVRRFLDGIGATEDEPAGAEHRRAIGEAA